jgi:hypothetical protein
MQLVRNDAVDRLNPAPRDRSRARQPVQVHAGAATHAMAAHDNTRCPRCGNGFRCGVDDAGPCACTTPQLDAVTLADLRTRYAGCLCLACLREIATQTRHAQIDR